MLSPNVMGKMLVSFSRLYAENFISHQQRFHHQGKQIWDKFSTTSKWYLLAKYSFIFMRTSLNLIMKVVCRRNWLKNQNIVHFPLVMFLAFLYHDLMEDPLQEHSILGFHLTDKQQSNACSQHLVNHWSVNLSNFWREKKLFVQMFNCFCWKADDIQHAHIQNIFFGGGRGVQGIFLVIYYVNLINFLGGRVERCSSYWLPL